MHEGAASGLPPNVDDRQARDVSLHVFRDAVGLVLAANLKEEGTAFDQVLLGDVDAAPCHIETIASAIDCDDGILRKQGNLCPLNPRRVSDHERKALASAEDLLHRTLAHIDLFVQASGGCVVSGECAGCRADVHGDQGVGRGCTQGERQQSDLSRARTKFQYRCRPWELAEQLGGPDRLRGRPFARCQDPVIKRDRKMAEHGGAHRDVLGHSMRLPVFSRSEAWSARASSLLEKRKTKLITSASRCAGSSGALS